MTINWDLQASCVKSFYIFDLKIKRDRRNSSDLIRKSVMNFFKRSALSLDAPVIKFFQHLVDDRSDLSCVQSFSFRLSFKRFTKFFVQIKSIRLNSPHVLKFQSGSKMAWVGFTEKYH